jgi:hypothetical protein
MPFPCHAVPLSFRMCLSHLIYTVRPCLIHICHAAPMPCSDHAFILKIKRERHILNPYRHGMGTACYVWIGLKVPKAGTWPLTSILCWGSEQSGLYFFTPISLYVVDKNKFTFTFVNLLTSRSFACRTYQLEHKQQQVIAQPIYPVCIVGFLDMESCCSDSNHVQGQRVGKPGEEGATYFRNVCYSLPVDIA